MQRLDRSPAHDTTTDDFLIFVTNGSQPGFPPAFLTKSGVNGPLADPQDTIIGDGEQDLGGKRHGAGRGYLR